MNPPVAVSMPRATVRTFFTATPGASPKLVELLDARLPELEPGLALSHLDVDLGFGDLEAPLRFSAHERLRVKSRHRHHVHAAHVLPPKVARREMALRHVFRPLPDEIEQALVRADKNADRRP